MSIGQRSRLSRGLSETAAPPKASRLALAHDAQGPRLSGICSRPKRNHLLAAFAAASGVPFAAADGACSSNVRIDRAKSMNKSLAERVKSSGPECLAGSGQSRSLPVFFQDRVVAAVFQNRDTQCNAR